jgi:hypothetical protein
MLLAKVTPGPELTFDGQPAGANEPITITGKLVKEGGHYYVTTATGVRYEIKGKDLDKLSGKTVKITGTLDPSAAGVLIATEAGIAPSAIGGVATGMSVGGKVIIAGVVIAGGTGAGVGIYEATKGPASK